MAQDIEEMRALHMEGVTINEIARRYDTTRQCVSKNLNQPLDGGYTMRILYVYRKPPCTAIDIDFLQRRIRIQNHTNDMLHRAYEHTNCFEKGTKRADSIRPFCSVGFSFLKMETLFPTNAIFLQC